MNHRNVLTLVFLYSAWGAVWAQGIEPDEGGIGGTGRSDTTLSAPIFDRPELPERIETPERPELPSPPEVAAPTIGGDVVSVPTPPSGSDNPAPGSAAP